MSPSVGISSPAIMRNTVVLPPPLGPSNASSSPSLAEKLTLLTAATLPNRLLTFFSSMLMPRRRAPGASGGLEWSSRNDSLSWWFGSVLSQGVGARLFPFQECLDAQRQQRQQGEQAGDGEGRGTLVFVVQFFHTKGHGIGMAGDMAGHNRHSAELAHRSRVAEDDAVDQTPFHRRQRDVPKGLPAAGAQRQ